MRAGLWLRFLIWVKYGTMRISHWATRKADAIYDAELAITDARKREIEERKKQHDR